MKKFLKQCLLVLVLVAIYFASDFYAKGQTLNSVLPVPLLGWIFWGLLAFAVVDIVVQPILLFRHLTRFREIDITKEAYSIRNRLDEKGSKNDLFWALNEELVRSLPKKSAEYRAREEKLSALVDEYYKRLSPEVSSVIKKYSWKAALCVVFSRNGLVDGVLMFLAQLKMAMELMRLYGYKLSPLFNLLCFFWIASNSALNGIFNQAGADSVGEILGGILSDGGLIEEGFQNRLAARASSCVIEALTSATTVYVTGAIINRKLKGEMRDMSIKELFRMRREGRAELLKDIPAAALENVKKCFC
ncbi:MAG: DUF697 domain-containing protein [Treponema sp.]|nr:DUF697 domain-containing protein [Treponema sp.]